MALSDISIRAAKPREKDWKLADEKGLYLLVTTGGSKLWRVKFRHLGKEKKLSLGAYPDVPLKDARRLRDEARSTLATGADPALERKKSRLAVHLSAATNFSDVAREFIDLKMAGGGRASATLLKANWFLDQLAPAIGAMPINDVDTQMLLAALKRLEAKGHHETAKKCRSFAGRVFRYGVATGRCTSDPANLLQGALITPKARHYAAILETGKLGQLLRAIEGYEGAPTTRAALRVAPHVFVRPGELRHAEWAEFDLQQALWNIPAAKMKARRPHAVPLSRQIRALLVDLQQITGIGKYVFPSAYGTSRPMSENTLNASFRRMGFGKDEVTAHGLRATRRYSTRVDCGVPTRSSGHSRTERAMQLAAPIIVAFTGTNACAWRSGGVTIWMTYDPVLQPEWRRNDQSRIGSVILEENDPEADLARLSSYNAVFELHNGRIEWLAEHIRLNNFQINELVAKKILAMIERTETNCDFEITLKRRTGLPPAHMNAHE